MEAPGADRPPPGQLRRRAATAPFRRETRCRCCLKLGLGKQGSMRGPSGPHHGATGDGPPGATEPRRHRWPAGKTRTAQRTRTTTVTGARRTALPWRRNCHNFDYVAANAPHPRSKTGVGTGPPPNKRGAACGHNLNYEVLGPRCHFAADADSPGGNLPRVQRRGPVRERSREAVPSPATGRRQQRPAARRRLCRTVVVRGDGPDPTASPSRRSFQHRFSNVR